MLFQRVQGERRRYDAPHSLQRAKNSRVGDAFAHSYQRLVQASVRAVSQQVESDARTSKRYLVSCPAFHGEEEEKEAPHHTIVSRP